MPLNAGARLGPYEIVGPVGAGGMGEVYRARDTRLDRTVAIKVLPGELSLNPQHRERFLREARAVSHLNHPHICTLHDIGSESGIDYLVMEYIDGETLQHRLRKGPLPLDEALRRGMEIADALDRAHRDHVVHRDLKPGNIMLTRSGAKILDFGLAKTGVGAKKAAADETVTQALTSEGEIVGTLQYMAPEQLEGKEADPRSDIFAFGAVLFEMIAGLKAFTGESSASLVASILTAEPPQVAAIPGASALDRVIRKCLAKNPDRRWQTAADLRDELEWIASGAVSTPVTVSKKRRLSWWLALPIAIALIASWFAWRNWRGQRNQSVWNLSVPPPADKVFGFTQDQEGLAISPDGRLLVYPVLTSRGSQLWLRDLASGSDKVLPGTDDGHSPFWSPDSRLIGFFAGDKLKKIGLSGPPEVICTAGEGRGGSWNRDGVIIFTPRSLSVIHRVPASGGDPVPITTLDPALRQNAHYWPHFLPDGRHFLYWAREPRNHWQNSGIFIGSLDDKPTVTGRSMLVTTPMGALYAPDRTGVHGHLLYLRGDVLVAQEFDPARMRLNGESFRVVAPESGPAFSMGQMRASVSGNGVLIYGEPDTTASRLLWKSRTGMVLAEAAPQAEYQGIRISPDGQRTAIIRNDPEIGNNIWSLASEGGITRVTLEPSHARDSPVWSPDGLRIAFASPDRSASFNLFAVPASGSREEARLTSATANQESLDWSPDGRHLLYSQISPDTQKDLWVLPLHSGAPPFPILHTPVEETFGRISPDGRWLAYCSNESGISNVYVQSFTHLAGGAQNSPKWTVTVDGGSEPVWRRDGKELLFRSLDGSVMSTPVESKGETFRSGAPKLLFEAPINPRVGPFTYDVSTDGNRFLMMDPVRQAGSRPLHVITDWLAARQQR